jgi:hypothetical protein
MITGLVGFVYQSLEMGWFIRDLVVAGGAKYRDLSTAPRDNARAASVEMTWLRGRVRGCR